MKLLEWSYKACLSSRDLRIHDFDLKKYQSGRKGSETTYLPLDPGLGLGIGRWGVKDRINEGTVPTRGTVGGVGGHVDCYRESRGFPIKRRRGEPQRRIWI